MSVRGFVREGFRPGDLCPVELCQGGIGALTKLPPDEAVTNILPKIQIID